MLAGERKQIEEIMRIGFIPMLFHVIREDLPENKLEAMCALRNLVSAAQFDLVEAVVKMGIIGVICNTLDKVGVDILAESILTLDSVLKAGHQISITMHLPSNPYVDLMKQIGGVLKIKALETYYNRDICKQSSLMLVEYFNQEERAMGRSAVLAFKMMRNKQESVAGGAIFHETEVGEEIDDDDDDDTLIDDDDIASIRFMPPPIQLSTMLRQMPRVMNAPPRPPINVPGAPIRVPYGDDYDDVLLNDFPDDEEEEVGEDFNFGRNIPRSNYQL